MVQYAPYMRHWLQPFIRALESRLRVDVRYAIKGSAFLLSPQIVNALFGGLASVILANILSANDFGTYKYVIAIGGVLGAFSLNNVGVALTRSIARGFPGSIRPILKASLIGSLLPTAAALVGAAYYLFQGDFLFFSLLLILALVTPILKGIPWSSSVNEGFSDFKGSAVVDTIRIVVAGSSLIVAAVLNVPLFFIVATYFFSHAVGTLIGFWYTLKRHPIAKDAPEDTECVRYAIHLSIMDMLSIVGSSVDGIIIFQLVGSEGLALYTIATILPAYLSSPFRNIQKLALPRLSEKTNNESVLSFMRKELIVMGAASVVVLGYIIVAPFAMGILFPKYPDAVTYSQIYMLSLLFLGSLIGAHLNSRIMIREKYVIKGSVALARVVLLFPLIALFGIWGAIFAQLATALFGYLVGNALILTTLHKEHQDLGK